MKYRKRPIEASQWKKNGDHPKDACEYIPVEEGAGLALTEGKVVRYYRDPSLNGQLECPHCGRKSHDHGWIDTLEGGHTVCPGDWIITGIKGEYYPCKHSIFMLTYERVT